MASQLFSLGRKKLLCDGIKPSFGLETLLDNTGRTLTGNWRPCQRSSKGFCGIRKNDSKRLTAIMWRMMHRESAEPFALRVNRSIKARYAQNEDNAIVSGYPCSLFIPPAQKMRTGIDLEIQKSIISSVAPFSLCISRFFGGIHHHR